MFARFRQTARRLQVSVVETRWASGKVKHSPASTRKDLVIRFRRQRLARHARPVCEKMKRMSGNRTSSPVIKRLKDSAQHTRASGMCTGAN
jgi:hypothetical protein